MVGWRLRRSRPGMACGCGIGCATGLVSHHRATYLDVRHFSKLLSRVERGEKIRITKRSKPVALLSQYQPPRLAPERQAAINHAIEVMVQGLPWGATRETFTRDEMHER